MPHRWPAGGPHLADVGKAAEDLLQRGLALVAQRLSFKLKPSRKEIKTTAGSPHECNVARRLLPLPSCVGM